jgi:hypothetical protein
MFWRGKEKEQENKRKEVEVRLKELRTKREIFDQIVKDEGYNILDGYYAQILYTSMEKVFDVKNLNKMKAEGKSINMDVKLIDTYTKLAYVIDSIVYKDEEDSTDTKTTLLCVDDLLEYFSEDDLKYLAIILENYTKYCNVDHIKVAMTIANNALQRNNY